MSDNIKIRITPDEPFSIRMTQERPQIIRLIESYSGSAKVSVDTSEGWALKPTYIPKNGEIIVYSDATVLDKNYPAIKIGDGNAYVVDLPFLGEEKVNMLLDHISDTNSHVTSEEKAFWNAKLNYDVSGEQLILTTN